MSDEEHFLSRWMRRKAAARQAAEAQPAVQTESIPDVPAAPPPAAAEADGGPAIEAHVPVDAHVPAAEPPAQGHDADELPSLDSLQGIASDYSAFMRVGVDERTRGAALKKLFSDPHFHFEQMDKLDIYIDDYGIPDPIPPAMLAGLEQARSLLFSEPATAQEGEPSTSEAAPVGGDDSSSMPAETPEEASKNEAVDDSVEDADEMSGEEPKQA